MPEERFPNPAWSDKELIAAIAAHSRAGAEALYDRYAVNIFKILLCHVKSRERAEGLLEITFLKIWNAAYLPDDTESLSVRIMGITRRIAKASYQTNPTNL